jgi:hypothetical protein
VKRPIQDIAVSETDEEAMKSKKKMGSFKMAMRWSRKWDPDKSK